MVMGQKKSEIFWKVGFNVTIYYIINAIQLYMSGVRDTTSVPLYWIMLDDLVQDIHLSVLVFSYIKWGQ